ncbi:S-type pyocin domain-containing protein [Rahnella contaminans]|uniref:S-type pyocin domain-containing protein n=1 Tax=Rahnella contaminans TaxID=2703882 RepID=UPI0023D9B6EE|nr:S-type pyocin domain-containing protein [Rahnella contaminans]MDF1897223.1 colicin D domain-containing protein [Rahnella contaminans]
MAQLASVGNGSLGVAGDVLASLAKGWAELKRVATVSTLGPRLNIVVAGMWPRNVGEGSDKVPGSDVPALFSYPVNAVLGNDARVVPGTSPVNLPVRGALVMKEGNLTLQLMKTGEGTLSGSVPVLNAVCDEATGLDRITVPAVSGAPSRTILINPAAVPSVPPTTGNTGPVPVPEGGELQDFVYWRPDAAGTGVESVYVMLSDPLDSGRFTRKQLDKKYLKHANDFGVNDTKKNGETLTKFRDAIEAHLTDKETVEKGTYLHENESKVFFIPKTNNVVILKKNDDFISGWHLTVGTPQYEIYIKTGNLK